MDWLLLAGLGIIWAAFLLPSGARRQHSPNTSVEEFEKNMDLLAETDGDGGRWVVTPRKGTAFLGPRERQRARIRERRRHVLSLLIEVTGIAFLIGLFPPLRGMWMIAGALGLVLVGYVFLLLRLKEIESGRARGMDRVGAGREPAQQRYRSVARAGYQTGARFVAEAGSRTPRASYAGLAGVGHDDESVHVVIRGRQRT